MTRTVAIIGRPNVGKSTLFNRLVGKRIALVDDTPGVTRDRREGEGMLCGRRIRLIDTAGLEEAEEGSLEARVRRQTERAVAEADVVLLLIDARAGVTPLDEHFADWLRRQPTPVIVVANKCEGAAARAAVGEAYALGFGDPVAISAEHGLGLEALAEAIFPADSEESADEEDGDAEARDEGPPEDGERALQLAIVGRPNVGKSTLINRLLGEERMVTGPEAGITRDAIRIEWEYEGRPVRLIDTAGLRRRAKVADKLERLSSADALRAVRFAHVVVLVLDATEALARQDLTIARATAEEGRALVVAVNKWDLVENRAATLRRIEERLEESLHQERGVRIVTLSALTGENCNRLMKAVFEAFDAWNRRVSTGLLNRWLAEVADRHPPPAVRGRPVRLRYVTQARTRPPTFALFTSRPAAVPESYLRYLVNSLREEFGFLGVPVRVQLRKGRNPYVRAAKGR